MNTLVMKNEKWIMNNEQWTMKNEQCILGNESWIFYKFHLNWISLNIIIFHFLANLQQFSGKHVYFSSNLIFSFHLHWISKIFIYSDDFYLATYVLCILYILGKVVFLDEWLLCCCPLLSFYSAMLELVAT